MSAETPDEPADVEAQVHASLTRREQLILGGGSRSIKVLCPPATLLALPNATVVEGLALAAAPQAERP
ncbi:MAG: hypothetical protein ABMA25_04830 [Ilumatobacteraceae bacterium]